jgi:hypothetical protein
MSEVERLLREALTPVEPPEGMIDRVERRLTELSDAAVEELADWELGAMRDPRNWVRPIGAAAVLTAAAAGLVVVRVRQRQKVRKARRLADSVREAAGDVRRRLPR